MKHLFFVVVLANLALFLWELQNADLMPQVRLNVNEEPDNKQIWLLSELTTESLPAGKGLAERQLDIVAKNSVSTGLTVAENLPSQNVLEADVSAVQAVKQVNTVENEKTMEPQEVIEEEKDRKQIDSLESQSSNSVIDVVQIDSDTKDELIENVLAESSTDQSVLKSPETKLAQTDDSVTEGGSRSDSAEVTVTPVEIVEEGEKFEVEGTANTMALTEQCIEVGPFVDKKTAMSWFDSTLNVERDKQVYSKAIEEISNYLVYFPAAESYQQSLANVAMLKQKGITDLWLFRRGELKGAISLGMFRLKSRAEKLVGIMQRKNLEVAIAERFQTQKRWFIRLHGVSVKVDLPLSALPCVE